MQARMLFSLAQVVAALAMGIAVGLGAASAQSPDKETKPAATRPKPATRKPAAQQPAARKPPVEKPPVEKPPVEKPAVEKPAGDNPAADNPNDAQRLAPPKGMVRLAEDQEVWFDPKGKLVVVDGKVAVREGQLEMFACPKGTKEHESVVAVNAKAFVVHAALLRVGASPGAPVQFFPEYVPAKGEIIDIFVYWTDEKGEKKSARAQEWIKHVKTGKAMEFDFVFAGSSFYKDEETGKEYYQAESGDLVCVSNFTTAMIDLPVESSQSASGLLFAAFTEKIPAKDTPVRLVFVPRGMKKSPPMAPSLE